MKDYNIDVKGDTFKTANLYEIELARITVTENVINSTIVPVLETHLCWYSDVVENTMRVAFYNGTSIEIRKVLYVNKLYNTITVDSAVTITRETVLCETLYDNINALPTKTANEENLQFYHSCFGTLTGTLLLTDYDVPIVAKTDRALYGDNSFAMYIPFPVNYKEISVETKGKMNTVEITAANVNKMLGAVYLRHDAFKNRIVKIRTIFFSDTCFENSLFVPFTLNSVSYKVGFNDPLATESFTYFVVATSVNNEFVGEVDNASVNIETLKIQATVSIDANEGTQIPRRLYSRSKCCFLYKRSRCGFSSDMTLHVALAATDETVVQINSAARNYYFEAFDNGETAVITIDNEQIRVNGFAVPQGHRALDYISKQRLYMIGNTLQNLANTYSGDFILLIAERGYGGTIPAAHSAGSRIDIPTCKKTEHDCILHCNVQNIGVFPAIPKAKAANQ